MHTCSHDSTQNGYNEALTDKCSNHCTSQGPSDPSACLFGQAIVIWDRQKNDHFGSFYTILGHFRQLWTGTTVQKDWQFWNPSQVPDHTTQQRMFLMFILYKQNTWNDSRQWTSNFQSIKKVWYHIFKLKYLPSLLDLPCPIQTLTF